MGDCPDRLPAFVCLCLVGFEPRFLKLLKSLALTVCTGTMASRECRCLVQEEQFRIISLGKWLGSLYAFEGRKAEDPSLVRPLPDDGVVRIMENPPVAHEGGGL